MRKILGLFSLVFSISCNGGLSPEAYIKYVESPSYPYRITKKMANKEFTLIYTPNDYLVLKSMGGEGGYDKQFFDNEMKQKENFIHFLFIISSDKNNEIVVDNSNNVAEVDDNLMYMMNDLQFDFMMKSANKNIPCVFANYERNFGISNKNNIQIVFEKTSFSFDNEIKIIYNDKIFNTGPIVFNFNKIKNKNLRLKI